MPVSAVVPPVRRPYAAAFRALIALAALTGVVIAAVLGSPARVLSHFTVQSNVLVAAVFAVSARRAWAGRPPVRPRITGAVLLYIAITAVVHHLVLAGAAAPAGWAAVADHLLHTLVPIGVALDWLLLVRPCGLRPLDAALWLVYPAVYVLFVLARGFALPPGTAGRYLYPFLDPLTHGYRVVIAHALVLGLSFYALSLAVTALDWIRPHVRGRQNRISSQGAGGLK
ncbi:Pr6Pr family membrane protein [Streptomyces coeruleoprunus]